MAATQGCARSRPPAPHVFFLSLFFFFSSSSGIPGRHRQPVRRPPRHPGRPGHPRRRGWLAALLPGAGQGAAAGGAPNSGKRERVDFFFSARARARVPDIPILLTSSLLTFSFLLRSSPSPTSPTPPAGTAAAPSSPGAWPNSTTSSTRTRAASGTTSPATGRSRSTPLSNWSPAATRPSTSWAGTRPRSPG